ncbi:unnamed protein product, partial [Rotaria sordida]
MLPVTIRPPTVRIYLNSQ